MKTEEAVLERLKIDVSMFSRLILILSVFNLQAARTCIIFWMNSTFSQIGPLTTEFAAFKNLTNSPIDLSLGYDVSIFLCFRRIVLILSGYFQEKRTSFISVHCIYCVTIRPSTVSEHANPWYILIKFCLLIHFNIVWPMVCKKITRLRRASVRPAVVSS